MGGAPLGSRGGARAGAQPRRSRIPARPRAPGIDALIESAPVDQGAVVEGLSRVGLIAALPPEELASLVPRVERLRAPAGTHLFEQGDEPDGLYMVDSGSVRVLRDGALLGTKRDGGVFGEMALLAEDRRTATVVADTDVSLWRVPRDAFRSLVATSPRLAAELAAIAREHRAGLDALAAPERIERGAWRGTVLRALDARRALHGWQIVMVLGVALWAALLVGERTGMLDGTTELLVAIMQLVAGLTVIQGACEAFVLAVERTGARLGWDGFLSGTIGSLVSTLPEFVVIAFLVSVDPLAAFVTAAVTIFNNALVFSVYSFFLPKDQKGRYLLPPSLSKAGAEVLVAGSGIAMIVGAVMLALRGASRRTELTAVDLLVVGGVLIVVYGYYVYELVRYYAGSAGEEEHPGYEPDPGRLGHDTSWAGIASMYLVGGAASYVAGEAIGSFAQIALGQLGLPTIPTAAGLAFFAGISEYIIVWKAHRRGELGIALSNTFGGMTQVMFLLLPFAMLAIAAFGLATGSASYVVPIDLQTTFLMLLLFPLFYVLLQFLRDDHTLSNLDAAVMTGIYALLLYFLFTA